MSHRTDGAESDGVIIHLDNMRLDKGAEQKPSGHFLEEEEPPTKPGVPKAKASLAVWKCKHGLRLSDCEPCSLEADAAGRYSFVSQETDSPAKKGD